MSTTITFGGNRTERRELRYTGENQQLGACRVLVKYWLQNDEGEWVSDEPSAHDVKNFYTVSAHGHDSCGVGAPSLVEGLERSGIWLDNGMTVNCTTGFVVVDGRSVGLGLLLEYVSARIDRAAHTALAS